MQWQGGAASSISSSLVLSAASSVCSRQALGSVCNVHQTGPTCCGQCMGLVLHEPEVVPGSNLRPTINQMIALHRPDLAHVMHL